MKTFNRIAIAVNLICAVALASQACFGLALFNFAAALFVEVVGTK
jgi:hypothetical protein